MIPDELVRIGLIGVIVFCALFGVVLPILGARQGIAWEGARIGIALVGAWFSYTFLHESKHWPDNEALLAGGCVALVFFVSVRKRSRHIPASVRRRVIARDLKGKSFDPKTQHLDHRMPFARGGSHTADNLRVLDKKANLKKGKKFPRPSDWF